MSTYEKETKNLLRQLGVNGSYLGFQYTAYGVRLVIDDPTLLIYVCKGLYVDISSHFDTDIKNVERNIRTVKSLIWKRGNKELLEEIFCTSLDECPTNAYFIDALANYIVERCSD